MLLAEKYKFCRNILDFPSSYTSKSNTIWKSSFWTHSYLVDFVHWSTTLSENESYVRGFIPYEGKDLMKNYERWYKKMQSIVSYLEYTRTFPGSDCLSVKASLIKATRDVLLGGPTSGQRGNTSWVTGRVLSRHLTCIITMIRCAYVRFVKLEYIWTFVSGIFHQSWTPCSNICKNELKSFNIFCTNL